LEFAVKLLGCPPCYTIGSLIELSIPNGLLFQPRYGFLTLQKSIPGPQRSVNIFVRPSIMLLLFTEINWNLDEIILERYWRLLYSALQ
jgi:hypothetical protein